MFFFGQDVVIKVVSGGSPALVEQLRNVSLEVTVNLLDATCMAQQGRVRVGGLEDYTLSFDFFQDSGAEVQSELRDGVDVVWEGYFEGEGAGQLALYGTAQVNSTERTGEIDGLVVKKCVAVNQLGTGLGRGTNYETEQFDLDDVPDPDAVFDPDYTPV